ncbi:hypothetical protein DIPPA_27425 [Diplonema papillatum]|nr:hypothetical protein DIPPA_27425 [Diplonema papillatum]
MKAAVLQVAILALLSQAADGAALTVLSNVTVGQGGAVGAVGNLTVVATADAGGTMRCFDASRPAAPVLRASTPICAESVRAVAAVAALQNESATDAFVVCPTRVAWYQLSEDGKFSEAGYHLADTSFSFSVFSASRMLAATQTHTIMLEIRNGRLLQTSTLPGVAGETAVAFSPDGQRAFVGGQRKVDVFDVADPASPVALASLSVPLLVLANVVVPFGDRYLLVGGPVLCFAVVDISDLANPQTRASMPVDSGLLIAVSRKSAYVACTGTGSVLYKIDLADPAGSTLKIVDTRHFPYIIDGLAATSEALFVATNGNLIALSL